MGIGYRSYTCNSLRKYCANHHHTHPRAGKSYICGFPPRHRLSLFRGQIKFPSSSLELFRSYYVFLARRRMVRIAAVSMSFRRIDVSKSSICTSRFESIFISTRMGARIRCNSHWALLSRILRVCCGFIAYLIFDIFSQSLSNSSLSINRLETG